MSLRLRIKLNDFVQVSRLIQFQGIAQVCLIQFVESAQVWSFQFHEIAQVF